MPEARTGRLLLVEDEESLAFALEDRLTREGHNVTLARDGVTAMELATSRAFDMIILDVTLPRKDGFAVCAELRESHVRTPILMLTARAGVNDRVRGLRLGADDYLAKPFATIELLARIEALLRRAPARPASTETFVAGDVTVDFVHGTATRADTPLQMSPLEMKLLRYLAERRGLVVSRDELLEKVWGHAAGLATRTVDVHIASLRQKLERNPAQPEVIQTVYGAGYSIPETS
ncbi:MAG TPA: response regulator transcription factor [Thermoanaerobaculia bacterium]|nr:response regulator transcription factor [Thermoanaerobaculia bacterium]